MKKLLFISNMAAPYQVKLCYELQKYFNAEFWFYVHLEKNRPDWWAIPLGDKCKVLENSFFFRGFNYNNFRLLGKVINYNPDVILLGGFFLPSHYMVKRWAKKNHKKVVIYSERISFNASSPITKKFKHFLKVLTMGFFKDIDLLFAMGEKPLQQYVNEYGFNPSRVVLAQYPQDIDVNLETPLRKTASIKSLIFPNRLDHSYNPLFALEVFKAAIVKYPYLTLSMNAQGELKEQCLEYIDENGLASNVEFLEKITAWDDLPKIYASADIALFTATDSNGPNALIECMASGTGVILSKHIHNTQSYAKHNLNCFICDLDINQFVDAISAYIENENLISEHGSRSKKLVENRSVKETAKLYYDLIEGIC